MTYPFVSLLKIFSDDADVVSTLELKSLDHMTSPDLI